MLKIASITLLLFSLNANAGTGYEGSWTGKGTLQTGEKQFENCTAESLELKKEKDQLHVKGKILCESRKRIWDYRLKVEGEDISENGKVIGRISDTEIVFHIGYEAGYDWTVNFEVLENDTIHYTDLYGFEGEWTHLALDFERKK